MRPRRLITPAHHTSLPLQFPVKGFGSTESSVQPGSGLLSVGRLTQHRSRGGKKFTLRMLLAAPVQGLAPKTSSGDDTPGIDAALVRLRVEVAMTQHRAADGMPLATVSMGGVQGAARG